MIFKISKNKEQTSNLSESIENVYNNWFGTLNGNTNIIMSNPNLYLDSGKIDSQSFTTTVNVNTVNIDFGWVGHGSLNAKTDEFVLDFVI